jgi:hypothetical protein
MVATKLVALGLLAFRLGFARGLPASLHCLRELPCKLLPATLKDWLHWQI